MDTLLVVAKLGFLREIGRKALYVLNIESCCTFALNLQFPS